MEKRDNPQKNEEEMRDVNKSQETPAPKTKKHPFKIIGIVLLILLLPLLLFAGWLGFVPGLSNIMGARSVRDLGVSYSEQDYVSYLDTTNTSFLNIDDAPTKPDDPNKKVVFSEQLTADDMTLSQEEITAAINESNWVWMPLKDVQVRMNQNNVEVAGKLNSAHLDNFIAFIGGVDVSSEDIATATDWANRLMRDAPVYLSVDTEIVDGKLDFTFVEGEIGRFSIPNDIGTTVLKSGTEQVLTRTPLLAISSATFQPGSLQFSGEYPSTVYVKTE